LNYDRDMLKRGFKGRVIRSHRLKLGLPRITVSTCPICGRLVPARVFERDGKVIIGKDCPHHGHFEDVYNGDVEVYEFMEKWAVDGVGLRNPNTSVVKGCPWDCGLCSLHFSHSGIVNIDLTNRCNMRCPICFANAAAAGYVYEPDLEEIVAMMELVRSELPVPAPAVQFAGGEPTIYPHFFEVVREAKRLGFSQIQVATNGLKLAEESDFCQRMADAGMNTVYLQFDGFKSETYAKARGDPNFLEVKMRAIENCRAVKPSPLATVLVPTVLRGVNDDEVGQIVSFALDNIDVIRGVNFQPVSLSGRIPQEALLEGRYTLGDLVNDLLAQTDYFNSKEDFFPVPVAGVISELASAILNKHYVAFTSSPYCGLATYLFKFSEGGTEKVIPITEFVDVEGFMREAVEMLPDLEKGKFKFFKLLRAKRLLKYIDEGKLPQGMGIKKLLWSLIGTGKREYLAKFHWNSLFIGAMHFMDPYDYDVIRVMRCVVHYATPDGRIIPFCSYNTGPTYRRLIEMKFSMSPQAYSRRVREIAAEAVVAKGSV